MINTSRYAGMSRFESSPKAVACKAVAADPAIWWDWDLIEAFGSPLRNGVDGWSQDSDGCWSRDGSAVDAQGYNVSAVVACRPDA